MPVTLLLADDSVTIQRVIELTFANEDVSRLVAALRALGPRVLLDWGFPPECLHLVEDLKERGVQLWWFNAQRGIAREEFIKRGTGHVADFDHQMDEIEMLREDIDEAFKPHVLTVLSADGRRMAPAEIWQQVSSHAA